MQEFNNAKMLVTGGAGFVGSNLTRRLLSAGAASVRIVDNLLSAHRSNIPADERISFTEGSIADESALRTVDDEYDYIFHLSTYHGNQSSIANPLADHENNVLTTLKLLEHIKNFKRIKKWVYSGAGCAVAEKTFGEAHATSEDAPISLEMDSPYSISKIIGEYYAVYYHKQYAIPTVRARFQNVYGPGEILGAGEWRGTPATVWRNVVPTFVYKALHQEPLPLENNGIATRDFIFVEDIVSGLMLSAARGKAGDVYNLASGVETSILKLAELVNSLTDNYAGVTLKPARTWDHSGKRFGSRVKSKQQLGFSADTKLEAGLAKTIEWTRLNMALIENCIANHEDAMREYEATR